MAAGYFGGRTDAIIMRICDVFMALPSEFHHQGAAVKIGIARHGLRHIHERVATSAKAGDYLQVPRVKMQGLRRGHEFHRAVDAAARIPAVALLEVLQAHGNGIRRAVAMDVGRRIDHKGVVAIGPAASQVAVHIDVGIGHGAVKSQFGVLVALRHSKGGAIVSAPYPGQGTRAAGMLGRHIFAILLDSHHLQVPFLVERAVDGPIVGHGDAAPLRTVATELPLREFGHGAHLARGSRGISDVARGCRAFF